MVSFPSSVVVVVVVVFSLFISYTSVYGIHAVFLPIYLFGFALGLVSVLMAMFRTCSHRATHTICCVELEYLHAGDNNDDGVDVDELHSVYGDTE